MSQRKHGREDTLGFVILSISLVVIYYLAVHRRKGIDKIKKDHELDTSLEGTFPASDPVSNY